MRCAYFLPRIFYIMQSRPKTLPCHSCGRILVLWILLKEKKFKSLEPNGDCISLLPLFGSILNSLGILCAQCLANKWNLLPPVSRNKLNFWKHPHCSFQIFIAGSIHVLLKKFFTKFVTLWRPTKIQLKIIRWILHPMARTLLLLWAPPMRVRNKVKHLVILVHTKRFYQFAENQLILQKKLFPKWRWF